LLERLPPSSQRSVVVHELAHLRRRDHWVSWLQLVAECIWWWNPVFWYVRRQLRLHAELACDAWVVATRPKDRRAYAEALIEITQLVSQTTAPLPALGIRSAARHDFERRLTMIVRDHVPCRVPLLGLVAIGVLALVCFPGWSQSDAPAQAVPEALRAPQPENAISLILPAEVDYQELGRNIELVQEAGGDKPLRVESEPASGPERDRRIERLEQQLRELLKEVEALRAGNPKVRTIIQTAPARLPGEASDRPRVRVGIGNESKAVVEKEIGKPDGKPGRYFELNSVIRRDGEGGMTLTRAVYKLPHAKAEALARLLSEHTKVEVLETRVEGDSLIVTTTPEAQKAIRQFISLLGSIRNAKVNGFIVSPDEKTTVIDSPDLKVDQVLELRLEKLDAPGKNEKGEKKKN
jgi:hypothetical protein